MGRVRRSLFEIIKLFIYDLKRTDNNIFFDWLDALFGALALIVIPFISIFFTLVQSEFGLLTFAFPMASICIAGLYDSYGRIRSAKKDNKTGNKTGNKTDNMNMKLRARIVLDILAFFVTAFSGYGYSTYPFLRFIPSLLLLLSGFIISRDVYLLVKASIECSDWYINHILRSGD